MPGQTPANLFEDLVYAARRPRYTGHRLAGTSRGPHRILGNRPCRGKSNCRPINLERSIASHHLCSSTRKRRRPMDFRGKHSRQPTKLWLPDAFAATCSHSNAGCFGPAAAAGSSVVHFFWSLACSLVHCSQREIVYWCSGRLRWALLTSCIAPSLFVLF